MMKKIHFLIVVNERRKHYLNRHQGREGAPSVKPSIQRVSTASSELK